MLKRHLRAPSPALVISLIALFVALGGTSLAASKVLVTKHKDAKADTTLVKKLAPSLSVKHAKTANSAVTAANATHATTADSATSATNSTHATSADSATNATNAVNASTLGGQAPSAFASSSVEATHLIGAAGEPAFQNSWSNFGSGTATAGFYKDPWGGVHLKGLIASGTTPAVIFTMPSGYAPSEISYFPVMTCGGYGDIIVEPNGDVRSRTTPPNTCRSLNGITYRAGS
jgi:hypothetical protein